MVQAGVRALLALVVAVGLCASAVAQSERRYGVISLLGDRLSVVGEEPQTGTLLKQNTEESMELASDAFDQIAGRAAVRAMIKAKPDTQVVFLRVGDSKVYAAQQDFISGDQASLPPALLAGLKGANVTHLVLFTKRRAPANLQLHSTRAGHGVLRGLGYYVNRWSRMSIAGTSETAVGYLGAFAYFDATLIELETQKVLKSVPVTQSSTVSHSSETTGRDPWDIFDDKA